MGMYVCQNCIDEYGLKPTVFTAVALCEICMWLKGDHVSHITAYTNDLTRVFGEEHEVVRANLREQLTDLSPPAK